MFVLCNANVFHIVVNNTVPGLLTAVHGMLSKGNDQSMSWDHSRPTSVQTSIERIKYL